MPKKGNDKNNNNNNTTGSPANKQVASLSQKLDRVLSRIPKGTFSAMGGALGGPAGAIAGSALSTISGYGDYTVRQNSILTKGGVGASDIIPKFSGSGGVGSNVRIAHREYIMDIVAPNGNTFNVKQLGISPTNSVMFPWLSAFASKFQRYKIHGMAFYYKSTSTDYDNSGVVAITINYDPSEPAYRTMSGMMNSKFAVSTKPSMHLAAPVECDQRESPTAGYFIDHDEHPSDAGNRQTHKGMLNIATQGLTLPAGTSLGQLSVVYDIELMYPFDAVGSTVKNLSTAYDVGNVYDDRTWASRNISSDLITGFPSWPEDRILYTDYDVQTDGPYRINLGGTGRNATFTFSHEGTYAISVTTQDQTVTITDSVSIENGGVVHFADRYNTIGGAETYPQSQAFVVVDALAGSKLNWFDSQIGDGTNGPGGVTMMRIYVSKLS